MHYYIYDDFVQDKKFERDLFKIENRLADLDIAGKIGRLALFKNASELIQDEVKRGVTTVIVVGNDQTVFKVLDTLAETGATLGIIPLGSPNTIAQMLGIPEGVEACDTISNRLVEKLDLGRINGRRFVSEVRFAKATPEIVCDKSYIITPTVPGTIEVRNLTVGDATGKGASDPRDGKLELFIETPQGLGLLKKKRPNKTLLPLKRMAFESKRALEAMVDGEVIKGNIFKLEAEPKKLNAIVGKTRLF